MVKYILTALLLTSCASVPQWSEGPGQCAYETGKYEEGWNKDVVTGVAKSVSRKYICIENPEVVKLPSYLELLQLPPAKENLLLLFIILLIKQVKERQEKE